MIKCLYKVTIINQNKARNDEVCILRARSQNGRMIENIS